MRPLLSVTNHPEDKGVGLLAVAETGIRHSTGAGCGERWGARFCGVTWAIVVLDGFNSVIEYIAPAAVSRKSIKRKTTL